MILTKFNKILEKDNARLELVKGEGYFYWVGVGTEYLYDDSVPVPHFYLLTAEQWMEKYKLMMEKLAEIRAEHNL